MTAAAATLPTLEQLRAEQVRRWVAGDRPPTEEFLARHPEIAADEEAATVLVYGEALLREEIDGTLPDPAEYATRFPAYAHLLARQFQLHSTLSDPTDVPGLPGFEILRELGRGGIGVVYLARELALDRLVAIKLLLSGEYASAAARRRFQTEAEATARLHHPNIVAVHAVGESRSRPYLVLEYVAGGGLDQRLAGTPLGSIEAARIVRDLADAVEHAHAAGIVHRDLKPGNILLVSGGVVSGEWSQDTTHHSPLTTHQPKVSDFGLAKRLHAGEGLTATSQTLGTPSYMAPEQCLGAKDAGPAADVYALGAILYECLTGRPPFKAATAMETLAHVLDREPASPRSLNPDVPRDLETICLKCLSKEPAQRYGSAAGLRDDLQRFLDGRPVVARPVGTAGKVWRWAKRRPALASMTAALAILIPAALAGMTALYLNADRQRELAEEREREMLRWRVENANQMVKHAIAISNLPINDAGVEAIRACADELGRLAALGIDPMANRVKRADQLNRITKCYLNLGRVAEALEASSQAVAAIEACRAEQPESEMVRVFRQTARRNQAVAMRLARRFGEAIQEFDALLDELHRIEGPSSTWNLWTRKQASALYWDRAMSRHGLRQYAEAVSDYDLALQDADERNWVGITVGRAISLAHCGRAAEALEQCRAPLSNPHLIPARVYDAARVYAAASVAPELTTPQRDAAARESVELLKRAIAGDATIRAFASMEAELSPLHDRADFQAILSGK